MSKLSSRTILILLESCLQTCMTNTIAECTVNKLLMMDRGTVRNMYSFVHLVGFITKKFVTMHGQTNVKLISETLGHTVGQGHSLIKVLKLKPTQISF